MVFSQDQVAQNPLQPGLEHFHEWAATVFLCNLCWGLTTPRVKHLISILNLFPFKAIPPCLVTTCSCKRSLSSKCFRTSPSHSSWSTIQWRWKIDKALCASTFVKFYKCIKIYIYIGILLFDTETS